MLKLLRYVSLICCAFVIASFFLFAVSQTSHASQGQTSALSSGTLTASTVAIKPVRQEAQPRRLIDEVAAKLDSPFTGIVATHNRWVHRLLPTVFALLVYGLGLSYLARWAAGRPA